MIETKVNETFIKEDFNFSFNFFNFVGVITYDGIVIGRVSGRD